MTPEEVRIIIREELAKFIMTDRYVFEKHLQLFDGKNIQVAKGTGSSFGTETTQKVSFYGVVPVVQAGAITSPAAEVGSLKTAVDAIRTAIKNIGITA